MFRGRLGKTMWNRLLCYVVCLWGLEQHTQVQDTSTHCLCIILTKTGLQICPTQIFGLWPLSSLQLVFALIVLLTGSGVGVCRSRQASIKTAGALKGYFTENIWNEALKSLHVAPVVSLDSQQNEPEKESSKFFLVVSGCFVFLVLLKSANCLMAAGLLERSQASRSQ